jgi:chorismate mutase
MTLVRGIRGATRIGENTPEAILRSTKALLEEMIDRNEIDPETVASVFLTMTPDLNAEFPAYVAREMGWGLVPLLCASEIAVPHGMSSVIRVLIHVNTDKSQREIEHVYQGETATLRPDLFGGKDHDRNNEN